MSTKKYTKKHTKKYTKKRKGGKAIGSGTYGCVFRPALRCKKSKTRTSGISKLGFRNHSKNEWKQLQLVISYIKKIPHYKQYFLLDNMNLCNPASLTLKDKINFEKCFGLEEYDISQDTVNDNLSKLKVINMPYGGINLSTAIENSKLKLPMANRLLRQLLINAIIPMNKLRVYHFDLKADNVLYKNKAIKIIDFGEIGISSSKEPIPSLLYNRRIQFNSPFSRILFSDSMNLFINTYLQIKKITKLDLQLYKNIKTIIALGYSNYQDEYGEGHEKYLREYILPDIIALSTSEQQHILQKVENLKQLLTVLIIEYCTTAVINFIDFNTMQFDKVQYFNKVYSKNVDIYGCIMCYIPFIVRSLANNKQYKDTLENKIAISNIIIKFCFSDMYAAVPIDIKLLLEDLHRIDTPNKYSKLSLEKLIKN